MDLRLDIVGATDLLRAFVTLPQATEEEVSLAVVDGTGMIQTQARAVHRFVSRPPASLEKSVETRFPNSMTGEVFLNEEVAPYAKFVHGGTRPHPILPRNASLANQQQYAGKFKLPKGSKLVLRWATPGGGWAFARYVNHPGTQADPFLYEAAEAKRDDIVARFVRAVGTAKQKVGL